VTSASWRSNWRSTKKRGFTLSEIMMAVAIFSLIAGGAAAAFSIGIRTWRTTSASMDASCRTSTTLARIAYGVGGECGLRAAFSPVTASMDEEGWALIYTVPKGTAGTETQEHQLRYRYATETIEFNSESAPGTWTVIGRNISSSTIRATTEGVTVMVESHATAGNCSTRNAMTSAITFRNGG
jgi:prepilin-type N-terminal cleavage/methylation domain-containing protein